VIFMISLNPDASGRRTNMSDTFAHWRNALEGRLGPIHENDPQPGFYRTKPRAGERSLPVAIWRDDAGVHALRDGFPVDPCAVWTWCCMHPISYDTYLVVAERGEAWPEDVQVPGLGHNGGPAIGGLGALTAGTDAAPDSADVVRLKITVLWDAASAWLASVGNVTTQVEADRAANYAEAFSDLEKEAEEARTSEKKPVLEQGRAIDARWKPVTSAAQECKKAMKKALEPFLVAEARRIEEAEGGPGGYRQSPGAGTAGRRVALRRTRRVFVTDRNAFIAHYRRDTRLFADDAVQKVLLRLAEADLTAGKRVKGAELVEDQAAA
jgi:hypothetical protein